MSSGQLVPAGNHLGLGGVAGFAQATWGGGAPSSWLGLGLDSGTGPSFLTIVIKGHHETEIFCLGARPKGGGDY